jgi:hypothetical protein
MKVLVTGGYFDESGEGVIWHVDLSEERAEPVLRWSPPNHLRVAKKGFAGGSLGPDGTLYVAAHAAVVRVDPSRAVVTGTLHQPCMNDLHHVAVQGQRLWVSNTGLGAVDMFAFDGRFVGSHALLPAWANARRILGEDYAVGAPPIFPGWSGATATEWESIRHDDGYHDLDRLAAPFYRQKVPDYLHVNHVGSIGRRVIATCFEDGTLRDLHDFSVVAKVSGHHLHDGNAHGEGFWVTSTIGAVIELDHSTFVERSRVDLFETGHFGWCRGLAVSAQYLVVGLTELRRRPPVGWTKDDTAGSETSVLLLDRRDGRLLARVSLTDRDRHSKIYSILPVSMQD